MNGVVHDATGASVPGAQVVLKNVQTGVERSTVANEGGNYSLPSVTPGQYTLTVTAATFASEQVQSFTINVDQVVATNITLKAGNVKDTVEVEASAVEVGSTTALLGAVIDQRKVQDLPLNGRNFTQLLTLTPGSTPVSVGQNSSASNTAMTAGSTYSFPSINGQPNRSNLYLMDGMNDNNAWYNTYAVAPVVDDIQEFKVNSHNDAQYGQVTGGVVNLATKARTNKYHGAACDYIRNNASDAKTYFPSLQSYHLNQFGGTFGGPLSIPKLYSGQDRTFIFFSYEGTRYSKGMARLILGRRRHNWVSQCIAGRKIWVLVISAITPPASFMTRRLPTPPRSALRSSIIRYRWRRWTRAPWECCTRSSRSHRRSRIFGDPGEWADFGSYASGEP